MHCFFTTHHDGNMGLHVGDNPLYVHQNRERLLAKTPWQHLVFMEQVHGDEIVMVDATTKTPRCDAMISNTKGIGLCVMVADCIPLLFYDAPTQSIGVAHAGRAGSALHVSSKTVRAMQEHFGAKPESINVYMGPSIKACCYEVGLDACDGLEHVTHQRGERFFLDLREANRQELLNVGVSKHNIVDTAVCTCCGSGYFSYRKQKVTGRFVGVIGL